MKIEDAVMMNLTVEDYIDYINYFSNDINRYVENGVIYVEITKEK